MGNFDRENIRRAWLVESEKEFIADPDRLGIVRLGQDPLQCHIGVEYVSHPSSRDITDQWHGQIYIPDPPPHFLPHPVHGSAPDRIAGILDALENSIDSHLDFGIDADCRLLFDGCHASVLPVKFIETTRDLDSWRVSRRRSPRSIPSGHLIPHRQLIVVPRLPFARGRAGSRGCAVPADHSRQHDQRAQDDQQSQE